MSRVTLIFISILNCLCLTASSQEYSEWEIQKEDKEIEISYRWITSKDSEKAREMKADFFVNAPIAIIVDHFRNPRKLKNWQISEMCSVKKLNANSWQSYLQFNLPWPFKSKDLVTLNKIIEKDNSLIIASESAPGSLPIKDGVNRIQSLISAWKFVPAGNGRTQIIYTSISYDKPDFPRIIADPIIQDRLIKTIDLLRDNAEDEINHSMD